MRGLLALSRLIDAGTRRLGQGVAWLVVAAAVISAGNALIRKLFDTSSNAWLELQWYLFGAAFLLASAYTLRQNEHIRIDIIYGLFSRRVQHWIDLFGHVFFLMPFALLMVYYFGPWVWLSFRTGEMSTNAGGLILWPAKLMLLIGFSLLAIQGISEIIKKIAIMRGIIEDPTPFVPSHAIEAEETAGVEPRHD